MESPAHPTTKPIYASILQYQFAAKDMKYPTDPYCDALHWYVKLYGKYKNLTMGEIEKKLYMAQGLLTKKLKRENRQHRELLAEEIEDLCAILETPLSMILHLYENRDSYTFDQAFFDKLTILNRSKLTDIFNLSDILKELENKTMSKDELLNFMHRFSGTDTLAEGTHRSWEDPQISSLADGDISRISNFFYEPASQMKWYIYFPSNDSDIVHKRAKKK